MHFLSRSSNVVVKENNYVQKTSSDIQKIIAEYNHYYACNDNMQQYLARPFDLKIDGKKSASYKMNFLGDENVGNLFIKNSLSVNQLNVLFNQIQDFYFSGRIAEPPIDYVSAVENIVLKLESRAQATASHSFEFASKMYSLLDRINLAFHEEYRDRGSYLKESHGDMHLSNMILKNTRLYLIDPKGVDFLWMDAAYDLAKLSHSILGGYDYIINDVDFVLNKNAETWLREIIQGSKIAYEQVALNEAALFASMVPLHLERPDHIDKFLKRSSTILSDLGY